MTIVFVIVCIGVLVAAYGVGVCVRELRFYRARTGNEAVVKANKPTTESQSEAVAQNPTLPSGDQGPEGRPALGAQRPEDGPPRPRMGFGEPGMPTREDFANMTDEERRAAFAKMRERFGGRSREGGPQLSEEDRAKMREESEALREKWPQMTDEEKQKVEAEFREKYGYFRSPDRRGGRGFGGGRRPMGGGDSEGLDNTQ
jgi:hypothetical protein